MAESDRSWAAKSRDAVLLLLGAGMLVGETFGSLLFGRPADTVIVGAALALLGLVPILQKGAQS